MGADYPDRGYRHAIDPPSTLRLFWLRFHLAQGKLNPSGAHVTATIKLTRFLGNTGRTDIEIKSPSYEDHKHVTFLLNSNFKKYGLRVLDINLRTQGSFVKKNGDCFEILEASVTV